MTNQQWKRFENKAQLLRHIANESGRDIGALWNEYERQIDDRSGI